MVVLLSLLLAAVSATSAPHAFHVSIGWDDELPLAVSPAINAWHDTPLGASGNPHHDTVYPPSSYDIVESMDAARAQLRSPYVRLWSDSSYVYDWPNSTRKTVVGPMLLPPNTTETCRLNFPNCTCCPAVDCACCTAPMRWGGAADSQLARIAANTSWDFRALDIQVKHLQESVAFPNTTILQITGNAPPWWFWAPRQGKSAFADPTGVREGHYFSRILDWYCKGGMTDELGVYHHSGHNYTFGFLEVLNEMDFIAGPKYIQWYDGVTKIVRANHPTIKFIGNCHAGQGNAGDGAIWRQFLNQSAHAPGTPWPIDAVSFHGYSGAGAPAPGQLPKASALIASTKNVIIASQQSARVIKEVSPSTLLFMDEVGILLGCNPPFNVSETLGSGALSSWWNIQAVVWAMYVGELSSAGVDMIGCSQFVGWPSGPPGTPVGIPHGAPELGCPFQSQVDSGGNCPEMSMIDWTNGALNARSWAMKMMIDGLGNTEKNVLVTNVSVAGQQPRRQCKLLNTTVDADFAGGDICVFNMSDPSPETCAEACCADPACDHFVTLAPGHGYDTGACPGKPDCPVGGSCCYLKSSSGRQIKSMYPHGDCILGEVTAAPPDPADLAVYARAFAPAPGTSFPAAATGGSKTKGAVLLANLNEEDSATVTFDGLKGATLWSVVHGKAGSWSTPFRKSVSADDSLVMEPLAVYLAFIAE
jgi:hypothetical protein